MPWPTPGLADRRSRRRRPDAINLALLTAFDNPGGGEGGIDAVLVVQDGKLVVEHYKAGYDPTTAPLVVDGQVDHRHDDRHARRRGPARPDGAGRVPEWADPSDPRHEITIDDLLHMRSGLQWDEEYSGTSDVIEMLFGSGKDDRAHYAASKPLQDEPGSTWYYSTGTSMILSRIIADHVGYGDEGTTWAQEACSARSGSPPSSTTSTTRG